MNSVLIDRCDLVLVRGQLSLVLHEQVIDHAEQLVGVERVNREETFVHDVPAAVVAPVSRAIDYARRSRKTNQLYEMVF